MPLVVPVRDSFLDQQRAYEPSRLFDDVATEGITVAGDPSGGEPFTLACWVWSDTVALPQALMSIGNSGGTDYHALFLRGDVGGDPVDAASFDGAATSEARTTTGYSANTLVHACGVWAAPNDRRVYVYGGSKGVSAGSRVVTRDACALGVTADSTPIRYLSGRVFWPCAWNVALTDDEIAAIGDRSNPTPPWEIRPESIVSMPSMRTLYDPFMRAHWTATGTVLAPAHKLWSPPTQVSTYTPATAYPTWLVVPSVRLLAGARVVKLAWTSREDGVVEYEFDGCRGRPLLCGTLHRVETRPSETEAPSANWDCVLEDVWGVDVLGGLGQDRSATDPEAVYPYLSLGSSGHSERGVGGGLTLKISGAGAGKCGVVEILTLDP